MTDDRGVAVLDSVAPGRQRVLARHQTQDDDAPLEHAEADIVVSSDTPPERLTLALR